MRHTRLSFVVLIGLVVLLWGLPVAAQDGNNTVLIPTTQDDGTESYFEAQLLTAVGTAGDTPFGILLEVPEGITQTKLHLNESVLTLTGGTLMLWRGELIADLNDLQAAIENGVTLTTKRRPDRWEAAVVRGAAMVELAGQDGSAIVVVAGGSVKYGNGLLQLGSQSAESYFNAAALGSAAGHDNAASPWTASEQAMIKDAQSLLTAITNVNATGNVAAILLGKEPPYHINTGKADKNQGQQPHLVNYLLNEAGLTPEVLTRIVVSHPETAKVVMNNIRRDPGAVEALQEEVKKDPAVMDVLVGISKSDPRAVDTAIQVAVGDKGAVDHLINTLKTDEKAGDVFVDRLSDPGTQQVVVEAVVEWVVDDPVYFYLPYLIAEFIDFAPEEGISFMVSVLNDDYYGDDDGYIWMVGEVVFYNPDALTGLVDLAVSEDDGSSDAADLLVDAIINDEYMAEEMALLSSLDGEDGDKAKDFIAKHPEVKEAVEAAKERLGLTSTPTPQPDAITTEPAPTPETTATIELTAEATPVTSSEVVSATPSATATTPPDADLDTIPDATDNCPSVANTSQKDADVDTMGDACDPDLMGTIGTDVITIATSGGGLLNTINYTGATNVNANDGDDTISIQGTGTLSGTLDGGAGNDNLDLSAVAATLVLNSGSNTANGTDFINIEQVMFGGGNDTITINAAGMFRNPLDAGAGTDTLSLGNATNPTVTITGATTTMNVVVKNPVSPMVSGITNINNVETVVGSSTDDTIGLGGIGGTNAAGSMVVDSGGGADYFGVSAGITGYWTLAGTIGTLDFSTSATSVNVNLSNTTTHQDIFGNGSFFLWIQGTVDRLFGGSGDDTLTGNSEGNLIDGGAGNDAINGGAGNDTIYGSAGDDVVYGSAGSDTLDGGTGVDVVYGGFDGLGTGDDSDTINDTDSDNDTLYGGSNNYNTSGASDDGGDTFNLGGSGGGTVYGGNNNSAFLQADDSGDTFNISDTNTMTIYGGNQNSGGYGTDGNDTINDLSTGSNGIYGGSLNMGFACDDNVGALCADGSDTIISTGNDMSTVFGGNFNQNGADGTDAGDTIFVASGAGQVIGDNYNFSAGSIGNATGTDTITIGQAADTVVIYGGNGNVGGVGNDVGDTITDSNDVANVIYGGNGNITSACNGTNCNDGGDTIQDTVNDVTAVDTYYGGNQNYSGVGNDTGAGDAIQSGVTPNDIIYTGNQNSGGTGADTNSGTVTGGDDVEGGNGS